MARFSPRRALVAVIVLAVVILIFRGAGRWLVDAVGTIHGHASSHR